MTKKRDKCPWCGGPLRTVLAKKRWNRQECLDYSYCCWEGKPFEPEVREVTGKVNFYPINGCGWKYEIKDGYGQPYIASRGFGSDKFAAQAEMERELTACRGRDGGPYYAYLVPPSVEVQCEVWTSETIEENEDEVVS